MIHYWWKKFHLRYVQIEYDPSLHRCEDQSTYIQLLDRSPREKIKSQFDFFGCDSEKEGLHNNMIVHRYKCSEIHSFSGLFIEEFNPILIRPIISFSRSYKYK